MSESVLWSIEPADLTDNYADPDGPGDVIWHVPASGESDVDQRWPLFHPSEADPEGGYRSHPYTVEFTLDHEPAGTYLLRLHYLAIAPRLANLQIDINGATGSAYLCPEPSRSGEIRLHAGLHTSIYAEGRTEVMIPASLLHAGLNRLTLTACDGGEVWQVEGIERIRRLDRMADGAGFIYQQLTLSRLPAAPESLIRTYEVRPTVLYRHDQRGTLKERCYLYVELNRGIDGGGLDLDLECGERLVSVRASLTRVAFGHLLTKFEIPDGAGSIHYTLRLLHQEGEERGEGEFSRCRKWKVYVTPHVHTDIGYTHRQWEVAERLCRNIDTALDLLSREEREGSSDDAPSFAYHLDSSWALETYLATRNERQRARFVDAVRRGQIGVPIMYVDLLTQFAALEDLIRNGELSETVLRPEELQTDFAAVVDVASLSGSLPDVLQGSGVKYLVHADNQDRGPFRLLGGLHRQSPFYWEGPADGKVLVWLARMYCELRKVCGSPPLPSAAERGLQLWLDEYERPDYAPDAVLLYGQEADNTDLDPQPAEFVRRWNETHAYPRLIPCAVSEFFRYVEDRFSATFKTFKGDGGAYWEDGVGSHLASSAMVRSAQASLPAAEILESLAAIHTSHFSYPLEQYDEAWHQVLLFDEHTWGAFLSGPDPDALLQRDQWSVKEAMAREAAHWSTHLLHTAAVRHSLSWNTAGREVVVYNPHSWTMSGAVTVEIGRDEIVIDPRSGEEVSSRRLRQTSTQAEVELWIDEIEGLSYRRFPLRPSPPGSKAGHRGTGPQKELGEGEQGPFLPGREVGHGGAGPQDGWERGPGGEGLTLESDHHRLLLDPERGSLASWYDKTLGKELIDQSDPWGFGQLLYARGGEGTRLMSNCMDLPEGNPEVLAEFRLTECGLERYGHGQTVYCSGEVPDGTLDVEWTLPNRAPWIDLRFTYHKEERREKEAVYIAFPLDLPQAEILSDSQLGWVQWDQDELPGGCKEWLPLQTAILARAEKACFFIASPDVPLFCVGDVVRGRWPREMKLRGGRLLSYVLNNYWHTNYRASQGGDISFRYRLLSRQAIALEDAYRMGWGTRQPLYAHRISFQDFRIPRAPYCRAEGGTLARVLPESVVLTTIKGGRWADGFVLRLQEIAGRAQRAAISLPGVCIRRAWRCDLLERDQTELEIDSDGTLHVDLATWGLVTVRIETVGKER